MISFVMVGMGIGCNLLMSWYEGVLYDFVGVVNSFCIVMLLACCLLWRACVLHRASVLHRRNLVVFLEKLLFCVHCHLGLES